MPFGLPPYTLRCYEKIGLIDYVSRNKSGHRSYSIKDTEWVSFISRFKETGVPLKNIKLYAKLRKAGKNTIIESGLMRWQPRRRKELK